MIKPTVGRVILFYTNGAEIIAGTDREGKPMVAAQQGVEPFPASVCCVHSDRLINVGGFTANGVPFSKCSVLLLQDADSPPPVGIPYCTWMPYQIEQARKALTAG